MTEKHTIMFNTTGGSNFTTVPNIITDINNSIFVSKDLIRPTDVIYDEDPLERKPHETNPVLRNIRDVSFKDLFNFKNEDKLFIIDNIWFTGFYFRIDNEIYYYSHDVYSHDDDVINDSDKRVKIGNIKIHNFSSLELNLNSSKLLTMLGEKHSLDFDFKFKIEIEYNCRDELFIGIDYQLGNVTDPNITIDFLGVELRGNIHTHNYYFQKED